MKITRRVFLIGAAATAGVAASPARATEWAQRQRVVMSVDVARFGNGVSTIVVRERDNILDHQSFGHLTIVELGEKAIHAINQHHPDVLTIEDTGIASGLVDYLRHHDYPVNELV